MKKNLALLALAFSVGFVSCTDNDLNDLEQNEKNKENLQSIDKEEIEEETDRDELP